MTPLQIFSESIFWGLSATGFGLAFTLDFPMPVTGLLFACVVFGVISGPLSNIALATTKGLPEDFEGKEASLARQGNWNYLAHALRWIGTAGQVITLLAQWVNQ